MSATQLATDFASELGDKLKHEAQKVHALELVTRPMRKPEKKKKSKLGMLTLVVTGIGIAYAVFRMLRPSATPQMPATHTPSEQANGSTPRPADQRLATAGL
jgi:hypothetical protein